MSDPVLRLDGIEQTFRGTRGVHLRALDGVSLSIGRGETLGLVGESGSGKSTIGRTALRLYRPTAGSVHFEGHDITRMHGRELGRVLRRRSAMIFQNPSTSLNPALRLADTLDEPLRIHRAGTPAERRSRVGEALERVGLDPAMGSRYPKELSGGQRQRVGVARALMLNPALVVADEPTASLDVSVQAQVVNLLADLQAERGFSYLFISHDLALVRHLSHRIAVLYLGRIVEIGPAADVFDRPAHPYTTALASMGHPASERVVPGGEIPSPAAPPPGCAFHPRCPIARDRCGTERPVLQPTGDGREVACHFAGELTLTTAREQPAAPPPPLPLPTAKELV
ncbi:ABC transporter ATP-binding protein [Actinoplanes derwentensis]|uniref:Peptide/nickel transport system ATP-binding protein n=1 Tax=Actinoplanes derwentensis TaxID=113562 RepID=A0A1H1ZT69_9ACTN|nr:oligopeptide/dipeptide ABC transporter ATP-binding protein [Actinoplanes derwentensis]GID83565.1 ABC transporter ATP-binding protein [Actinoplanes derwentensis]SDT36789.1 peptide/nickel transport system ATP-binding protein [Actinoplanes derwentensis]